MTCAIVSTYRMLWLVPGTTGLPGWWRVRGRPVEPRSLYTARYFLSSSHSGFRESFTRYWFATFHSCVLTLNPAAAPARSTRRVLPLRDDALQSQTWASASKALGSGKAVVHAAERAAARGDRARSGQADRSNRRTRAHVGPNPPAYRRRSIVLGLVRNVRHDHTLPRHRPWPPGRHRR
jgi:hypothetical protein